MCRNNEQYYNTGKRQGKGKFGHVVQIRVWREREA